MRAIGRFSLGVSALGILALGCAGNSDSPVAPRASAGLLGQGPPGWGGPGQLLPPLFGQAPPPTYFVCQGNGGPYTGSAVIGALGGQVAFGPHKLIVPPLGLLKPTTITATSLPGDTIAVVLQPQGLHFLLPASLQLSYAQCQNQPTKPLSVVYVSDDLRWLLELINSITLPGQDVVSGSITHFSVYAAAE